MKNFLKIVSSIGVIVLYCSVMSLYSNDSFVQKGDVSTERNFSNQQSYFLASSGVHNQIAENENSSVTFYSNILIIKIKEKLSTVTKAIEHSFFCTYSQYNFYSNYILLRFLQTDIIFPFHYYW